MGNPMTMSKPLSQP